MSTAAPPPEEICGHLPGTDVTPPTGDDQAPPKAVTDDGQGARGHGELA
jgi:hypothetical protein